MANTISDYFTDEDLEQNLRGQFDEDEMHTMDYMTIFKQINEHDDQYFSLNLRGKTFLIDRITGSLEVLE